MKCQEMWHADCSDTYHVNAMPGQACLAAVLVHSGRPDGAISQENVYIFSNHPSSSTGDQTKRSTH